MTGVRKRNILIEKVGKMQQQLQHQSAKRSRSITVQTSVSDDCRAVVAKLTERNTEFHLYNEKHLKILDSYLDLVQIRLD